MRVDPEIAAMRRDRTVLQRAQAAARAAAGRWREDARVAPILAELGEFGRGAPLSSCPALARLFGPGDAAQDFAAGFCRAQAEALAAERFAQLAFRHSWDGAAATLLLARSGPAHMVLAAIDPGSREAGSVVFSDALRHEAVLAGRGAARRSQRAVDGRLNHDELMLEPGARLALDLARQALVVHRVETRLVSLRLHRTNPDPQPTREYDPASGELRHQAAGDVRSSRHEMMLAALGRMKRREAAPTMAAMARERGPEGLRWQALREALALDTAEGFRALSVLARAPDDPLAMPAGALRAQLVEAHPELLFLEDCPCRA
jgi:hypothetical protein